MQACSKRARTVIRSHQRRMPLSTAVLSLQIVPYDLCIRTGVRLHESAEVRLTVPKQPAAVADYLKLHFVGRSLESSAVLFLDARHGLLAFEDMCRGMLTQTSVYPREALKRALHHNAAAVILAHNHPSGASEPSRADEGLTQTLKHALAMIDARVLDHLVIAGHRSTSLAERGQI